MNASRTVTSTSMPATPAASCTASTMWAVCAASSAASWLRTSPSMRQRSGTTLIALPPLIRPMLAVVASSMRPSFMAATADAAAAIALRPFSGAMPACAATP